ncbi:MAG: carbohydrate binding domain-containing protein [Ruminococcus sp.]|nr:carbohydrate binding domain-containing protein [Ruminococcus sp.]
MSNKIRNGISLVSALAMTTTIASFVISNNISTSAANLLTAEFETTNDSFSARGGNSVAWTSDKAYSDNCSLFVSNRDYTWNGAIRDASSFMKAGEKYNISAYVYQESGEPVEMKFSLQYKDATGETAYDQIALETASDSEWTALSNESYIVPDGATDLAIYIETTESLTDFYIDLVNVKGTPSAIKKGDANGDLKVNYDDLFALNDYLLAKSNELEMGADMNGDNVIDVFDMIMLRKHFDKPQGSSSTVSGDWDNYQEDVSPQMLQIYKDSLYRVGNTQRIREKIAKAQSGEKVNIAYLGGSITAGGSSSTHDNCYANRSCNYFRDTFGDNVNYINAGMAGTSSVVGNLRVDNDVLSKDADIIFIEFAVNDQDGERFKKSYESLVKKCLSQENAPAVVLITLCTQSGGSCQDWMAQIAENYDLPLISGRDAVMNGIKAGSISWENDYGSGDTIHPGDGGHKLIADCIGYYYRQALRSENTSDEYSIPFTSVFGSEYSTARIITADEMKNLSKGSWDSGTNNPAYSASGFTFSKNGNNPLNFTVEGKGIMLLFQSNSNDSMGKVNVNVNGKTNSVNSNLLYTWGGLDGDIAYYQNESGTLDVSISMDDPSKTFVLYGVAVIS